MSHYYTAKLQNVTLLICCDWSRFPLVTQGCYMRMLHKRVESYWKMETWQTTGLFHLGPERSQYILGRSSKSHTEEKNAKRFSCYCAFPNEPCTMTTTLIMMLTMTKKWDSLSSSLFQLFLFACIPLNNKIDFLYFGTVFQPIISQDATITNH